MRNFLLTDTSGLGGLNNPVYRKMPNGRTLNEKSLREWARRTFGSAEDAPLKEIARAIKDGGWLLFQYIPAKGER